MKEVQTNLAASEKKLAAANKDIEVLQKANDKLRASCSGLEGTKPAVSRLLTLAPALQPILRSVRASSPRRRSPWPRPRRTCAC